MFIKRSNGKIASIVDEPHDVDLNKVSNDEEIDLKNKKREKLYSYSNESQSKK